MAKDNLPDPGFGKSDAQLAKTFGMSASEFQKSKKKLIAEITKSTPKGDAAAKQYKKETSPQGVAKRDADAKKALEQKYPGMFIPSTRTTPGLRRP